MSVMLMGLAWKANVSPVQKLVLMAFADHADDDGKCWPGRNSISAKCGIEKKTLDKHVKALVEMGYLDKESRYRDDGSQASNIYHVNAEKLLRGESRNATLGGEKYGGGEGCETTLGEGCKTTPHESSIEPSYNNTLFGEQVAVVPPKKKRKEPKPSSEKIKKILYVSAYWQWAYEETQDDEYYMDWKKDIKLIKELILLAKDSAGAVCCWMASYLGDINRFPKDKAPTIAMLKNQFQQYSQMDCPVHLLPPDGEEWGTWKPWREDDEAEDVQRGDFIL